MAEAAVVVNGSGTIVALGPRAEMKSAFASLPEERAEGALLPGLVNAHTHLDLSILAGRLSGGQGLAAWPCRWARGSRLFRGATLRRRRCAALAAVATGTAAVGDVGNTLLAVPAWPARA